MDHHLHLVRLEFLLAVVNDGKCASRSAPWRRYSPTSIAGIPIDEDPLLSSLGSSWYITKPSTQTLVCNRHRQALHGVEVISKQSCQPPSSWRFASASCAHSSLHNPGHITTALSADHYAPVVLVHCWQIHCSTDPIARDWISSSCGTPYLQSITDTASPRFRLGIDRLNIA